MRTIVGLLRRNWFLCGIVCAVLAGLAAPGLGAALNAGKVLSTAAVVAIFLLSGLSLPSEAVGPGARNVRVHVLVQSFIFVLVPAYFYATGRLLGDWTDGRVVVGIYALAVLPTTISSCIVFTQMARGSVATAIFNAVLANLMGVFVSPLLLTWMLRQSGRPLPADEVVRIFVALALKVLVPFAAGQLLRLRLRGLAERHKRHFTTASGCLILLIVFLAFCRAAGSSLLRGGVAEWTWPLAYLAASNVLLTLVAFGAARAARLGPGDVAAVVFVAPEKTLALGIPLLTTYFASQPDVLAVAMLPILFYHPWQLVTAAVARRFVQLPEDPPAADRRSNG